MLAGAADSLALEHDAAPMLVGALVPSGATAFLKVLANLATFLPFTQRPSCNEETLAGGAAAGTRLGPQALPVMLTKPPRMH